jgi:hypothetical protein
VLSNRLQALPPLSQLPDSAQPAHFPPPPAADGPPGRLARACQAHALALAEARVGSKWWLPLRRLNRFAPAGAADGGNYCLDDRAAWQEHDRAWRRHWQRICSEEAARPTGLAAVTRRPAIEYSLSSEGCC